MGIFEGNYPFMTAYLKGEEAKLVSPEHIERLLRAKDVPEAVEILKDTDIGNYLDSVLLTSFDEADKALWFYLDDCSRQIAWFHQMPKAMQKLTDAYMIKYDVLNIKAALEAVSSGKKVGFIPLGTIYRLGWLGDLGNVQDVAAIKNILVKCGLDNYAGIVGGYQVDGGAKERLGVESVLDRQYYAGLFKVARKVSDRTELLRAFGTLMDIRNLKILMRGVARGRAEDAAYASVGGGYAISPEKTQELAAIRLEEFPARVPYEYQKLTQEMVASYGKNKNITAIGEIADRYEFGVLHDILSLKLMSPVMIVWYLILKETEVRNLRLVIRALFDNVPLEEIKGYLVMTV